MFARQVLPKLMFQRLGLDSGLRLRFTLSCRGRARSSVCACVHAGPPAGMRLCMHIPSHVYQKSFAGDGADALLQAQNAAQVTNDGDTIQQLLEVLTY